MRKNVVILTYGLSGSSVLTGLLVRAGYWPGVQTFKKPDYDTYENVRLVELNKRLFDAVGFDGNYHRISDEMRALMLRFRSAADPAPFREFVAECEQHRPWVWKDPRLWVTIRFWAEHLDLSQTQFLLLRRTPLQSWISVNVRRQIQSYSFQRNFCRGVESSIDAFFREHGAQHHDLLFDDLIRKPEREIARLNEFLGTRVGIDDLASVYNQPLRRPPRGKFDLVKAALIYARNFRERQA